MFRIASRYGREFLRRQRADCRVARLQPNHIIVLPKSMDRFDAMKKLPEHPTHQDKNYSYYKFTYENKPVEAIFPQSWKAKDCYEKVNYIHTDHVEVIKTFSGSAHIVAVPVAAGGFLNELIFHAPYLPGAVGGCALALTIYFGIPATYYAVRHSQFWQAHRQIPKSTIPRVNNIIRGLKLSP